MKRIEFAELADISPAMVTKYSDQGLIVFSADNSVDATATLALLEGRLDETKRLAALKKLGLAAQFAPASPELPAALQGQPRRTAKIEMDEIKRDLMQLELARRAGELIPIADVERAVFDAIADFRAAFDIEARGMADQLTVDLSLSPERSAMLFRRLRTLNNKAQTRFSTRMLALAGAEEPEASAPETDDAAVQA